MIRFKPITIADKELITSYIIPGKNPDCDFSFTNLYCWHFLNNSGYAIINDLLILRFTMEDKRNEYFMPIGQGNIIPVIEKLDQCARQEGHPLYLRGILPETRDILDKYYPTLFEYEANRDYFDYIYLRQDLMELKGKNYQPKRNHVNRFKKEYAFEYLPLTPDLITECLDFEAQWCIKHGYVENENIKNEREALTTALQHIEELDLYGAVIKVDNHIAAFTFGSPINYNTFGVHFEKADIAIEGSYSIINQEFAAHIPEQYVYLNREEDLGIPGLRQAKQSYHPAMLLEKCIAIKNNRG